MRKFLAFAGAALLAVSLPAGAITYGQPDGNGHPNVGALLAEFDPGQKEQVCTGTLISPTVFLTAAHCTAFLEANGLQAFVSFDSEITSNSKFYAGTMHTNPGYNQSQSDPGDIAVIVFAKPVKGITPAALPSAGMLDRMKADGSLGQGSRFTAVGYGVHQPTVGGGPPSFPFDNLRWVAVSEFNSLNNAWLRLSQVGPTGAGGTCFGDSGGPNFLGAGAGETPIVAALTVTGDAMCLATNVDYRLDTPAARAFLSQFVTLP
jgi:secreted trypsin-like serine protease